MVWLPKLLTLAGMTLTAGAVALGLAAGPGEAPPDKPAEKLAAKVEAKPVEKPVEAAKPAPGWIAGTGDYAKLRDEAAEIEHEILVLKSRLSRVRHKQDAELKRYYQSSSERPVVVPRGWHFFRGTLKDAREPSPPELVTRVRFDAPDMKANLARTEDDYGVYSGALDLLNRLKAKPEMTAGSFFPGDPTLHGDPGYTALEIEDLLTACKLAGVELHVEVPHPVTGVPIGPPGTLEKLAVKPDGWKAGDPAPKVVKLDLTQYEVPTRLAKLTAK